MPVLTDREMLDKLIRELMRHLDALACGAPENEVRDRVIATCTGFLEEIDGSLRVVKHGSGKRG